jgi:hypothetical protein
MSSPSKLNSFNYNNELSKHMSENSLKRDNINDLRLKKPPDEYSNITYLI